MGFLRQGNAVCREHRFRYGDRSVIGTWKTHLQQIKPELNRKPPQLRAVIQETIEEEREPESQRKLICGSADGLIATMNDSGIYIFIRENTFP